MTKEETLAIMALLGAFYAGGKNDPKMQAQAWHMILYKYDFDVAKNAVIHYAENDTRDYATFPAVGRVVAEIKEEEHRRAKPINEILNAVSYGRDYKVLSEGAKQLVTEEMYDEWIKVDAEEFQRDTPKYAEILKRNRLMLQEKNQ